VNIRKRLFEDDPFGGYSFQIRLDDAILLFVYHQEFLHVTHPLRSKMSNINVVLVFILRRVHSSMLNWIVTTCLSFEF